MDVETITNGVALPNRLAKVVGKSGVSGNGMTVDSVGELLGLIDSRKVLDTRMERQRETGILNGNDLKVRR